MPLIKLLLRCMRTVAWQLLLAEAAGLLFLMGYFFITEGVSQDTLVEVGETFFLVSKYFSFVVFFLLLERAMAKENKNAMNPEKTDARPARSEKREAKTAVAQPYVANATDMGPLADIDESAVHHNFEPAEHLDDAVVNPATGLTMLGGYEGIDSSGHTYDEGDAPAAVADAPAQMQLFN
jgi:hypothetical protein